MTNSLKALSFKLNCSNAVTIGFCFIKLRQWISCLSTERQDICHKSTIEVHFLICLRREWFSNLEPWRLWDCVNSVYNPTSSLIPRSEWTSGQLRELLDLCELVAHLLSRMQGEDEEMKRKYMECKPSVLGEWTIRSVNCVQFELDDTSPKCQNELVFIANSSSVFICTCSQSAVLYGYHKKV